MTETHERFTQRAAAYGSGRPSYPAAALDAIFSLFPDTAVDAIDLGAGTGISSRALAERGAHVVAVEPNAAMRERALAHPRVRFHDAPAEATRLPDASADLVAAFQAFHWFARPAIFAEIVRLARPGARAAVVGYERDESDAFTRAYGDLIRRYAIDDTEQRRLDALAAFRVWRPAVQIEVPFTHELTAAGLRERLASTSYVLHEGPEAEAMRAELDGLIAQAGHVPLGLAMRAIVLTAAI